MGVMSQWQGKIITCVCVYRLYAIIQRIVWSGYVVTVMDPSSARDASTNVDSGDDMVDTSITSTGVARSYPTPTLPWAISIWCLPNWQWRRARCKESVAGSRRHSTRSPPTPTLSSFPERFDWLERNHITGRQWGGLSGNGGSIKCKGGQILNSLSKLGRILFQLLTLMNEILSGCLLRRMTEI